MKQFFLLGIILIYSHISFSQNRIPLPERKLIPGINYFDNGSHQLNDVPFIKTDSIVAVGTQGLKRKLLFEYNNTGKIAAYTLVFLDGQNWENEVRDTLFYDSEGRLTEVLEFQWFPNYRWDSSSRISHYYTAGHLSSSIYQQYNQNVWTNKMRDNYEYTGEGYVKTIKTELWLNNQWENTFQSTYFYSGTEFRDSLLNELWENGQWRNERKLLFYYSSNNIDVDSIYSYMWNGGSWDNSIRIYIVNDNNHNQIEQLDQRWEGNTFLNDEKRLYSYSEEGYILTGNALLWNNGSWVQGDAPLRINNPDGLKIGFITNSIYGYYSNVTGVQDKLDISEYVLYQNYPNPFNPSTTISYSIPEYSSVIIKVFDILGNEIETLVNEGKPAGTYEVTWNAGALPSGLYFYRLQTGSFVETRKMILLK